MTTKEAVTFVLASVGVLLGIVNLWRDLRKTRRQESVQLEVRPVFVSEVPAWEGSTIRADDEYRGQGVPPDEFHLCIVIVNHSQFAVEVDEIMLDGSGTEKGRRGLKYSARPKASFPFKLDRNQSLRVSCPEMTPTMCALSELRGARVRTSTGVIAYGSSRTLTAIRDSAGPLLEEMAARVNPAPEPPVHIDMKVSPARVVAPNENAPGRPGQNVEQRTG